MSTASDLADALVPEAPRFVSFAQNFEDVMLWRALRHVEHGFYVDVGAQDPALDSVSKAFYDRGWDGIDIEPVPKYAALLRADRPRNRVLECALSDRAGREPLYVFGDSGLSTLHEAQAERNHDLLGVTFETREVEVRTLRDVLAETAREIHWLKIDVEGAEQEVLASWQGSPVHPWIVVVEATRPNETQPSHQGWEPILVEAGYEFAYFDGLNRFYIAPEHRELHAAFGAPPNVFDRFTLAAIDRLDRSFRRAERYAKSLEVEASSQEEARRSELDAQQALAMRRGAELDEAAVYAASLASELERTHIEMDAQRRVAERRAMELDEATAYAASLEAEIAARGERLQVLENERTRLNAALEESVAAATRDAAVRAGAFVELETYALSLQAELRKHGQSNGEPQARVIGQSGSEESRSIPHGSIEDANEDANGRGIAPGTTASALAGEVDLLRHQVAQWRDLALEQTAESLERARVVADLLGIAPGGAQTFDEAIGNDPAAARAAHEALRAHQALIDVEIGRIAAEAGRKNGAPSVDAIAAQHDRPA